MNFVVALHAEAKPIIDHLGLTKHPLPSPFALFSDETYQLVVSGMGKQNIAHAVSFLHGRITCKNLPWLNVGLAGHGNAPLGEAFQIAKFTDQQNEQTGYPPQVFTTPLLKAFLKTCNQPSMEYHLNTAYDMEGSAFFESAYRYSNTELVQSIKIISDNPQNPVSHFDKSLVHSLISPQVPKIVSLSKEMIRAAKEISAPSEIETLFTEINQIHTLTETQKHQIKKAIRHGKIVGISDSQIRKLAHSERNAKELIFKLNQKLEEKNLYS